LPTAITLGKGLSDRKKAGGSRELKGRLHGLERPTWLEKKGLGIMQTVAKKRDARTNPIRTTKHDLHGTRGILRGKCNKVWDHWRKNHIKSSRGLVRPRSRETGAPGNVQTCKKKKQTTKIARVGSGKWKGKGKSKHSVKRGMVF